MTLRVPILSVLCLLPALALATAAPPALPDAAPDPVAEAAIPPPPRVMLVTRLGEIVIELDAAAAPKTVANFLDYAREGHYNGTVFHRVVPGLLVQAGGFTPDLQHKPTRAPVASEADNGLSNRRGTLAAARDRGVVDSATAQFFINLADNPKFDHRAGDSPYTSGYTVFGRVLQGMEVVDRIAAEPTDAKGPFPAWVPVSPVVIERVQLLDPAPATDAPADAETATP